LPASSHLFAPIVFDSSTSKHPHETITPLAAKLGITINAKPGDSAPEQYDSTHYAAMLLVALACPGGVLIARRLDFSVHCDLISPRRIASASPEN
jgi:hypothetical protein